MPTSTRKGFQKKKEKRGSKCSWRTCGWKFLKPTEGNRYLGTGNTEGLKKGKPQQTYKKTYNNKNFKN